MCIKWRHLKHHSKAWHMVKYKGWSSMKRYFKNKPIKRGFEFWCRCASKSRYLSQSDFYLRQKENAEEKLRKCCSSPNWMLWKQVLYHSSNNFFNSPSLNAKLFDKDVYVVGTARKNIRSMPEMTADKTMKRRDYEFLSSKRVGCCKSS